MVYNTGSSALYITGLAHAYPEHSFGPNEFHDYVARLYPEHQTSPGLQKLMKLNQVTQINSRQSNFDISKDTKSDPTPSSIDELSHIFRRDGVELAASACSKALTEANLHPTDITHIVAVTCTDQSNPGYDLLVCKTLKLKPSVQRTLLHGVGCAGGLSALRAGATIAAAESQRGRPARVLVVACELCSLFLKAELHAASCDDGLHIAPALFSDAAAALVVCNQMALTGDQKPIYELQECGSMLVPNTTQCMSYDITANGMIASLAKEVPKIAVSAIQPMYDQLRKQICTTNKQDPPQTPMVASDFDWAVHPGGAAILQGAQQAMGLTDDHIRASLEIYRSYGNSSSPTVLVVLDRLRHMGKGRDNVVATSFGPGMMIEMCMMKRCRDVYVAPRLKTQVRKTENLWLAFQFRLAKLMKWHVTFDDQKIAKREHGPIVL